MLARQTIGLVDDAATLSIFISLLEVVGLTIFSFVSFKLVDGGGGATIFVFEVKQIVWVSVWLLKLVTVETIGIFSKCVRVTTLVDRL